MPKKYICPSNRDHSHTSIQATDKDHRTRDEDYYDFEIEWRKVVTAHQALNALYHRNIIKALGAYRQAGKYHLVLE